MVTVSKPVYLYSIITLFTSGGNEGRELIPYKSIMMKETEQQQPRAQQWWLRLPCYVNVIHEDKHIRLRFLGLFGGKDHGSGLLP